MFPLPLTITIAPSQRLRFGVLGLHGIAMMATWMAQLPAQAQVLLCVFLVASAGWHLMPGKSIALRCHKDGQFSIHTGEAWTPVEITLPRTWLPALTLLNFRANGDRRTRHLLILPDSLAEEDFRRLRVWLRWMTKPDKEPAAPSRVP
jgi:hypothetical protein